MRRAAPRGPKAIGLVSALGSAGIIFGGDVPCPFPSGGALQQRRYHNRGVLGQAFNEVLEDEHGHGPSSAFFHIDVKKHHLDDSTLLIDRKAFGVPFIIDDDAALDAAYEHHRCAVEVQSVERVLLPFWLSHASTGGYFSSEVLILDPTTLMEKWTWNEVPAYQFSYPWGDHFPFNQVSASYDPVAAMAEEVCAGTHVPSMLISRFELVEELTSMQTPPRFLPFNMTTKAAVAVLERRISRDLVHQKVLQELKKFHGNFRTANIKFLSIVAEVTKMKPVFLPMYSMMVTTASHSKPVPLFVCGATGRTKGPVVHRSHNHKFVMSAVAGAAALTIGALTTAAMPAAVGAVATSYFADRAQRSVLQAKADRVLPAATTKLARLADECAPRDKDGYKWTVEDEEAMEYSWREELRAKARRKADFEQRVKEEAAREEARESGKKFRAQGRRHRSKLSATADADPLGYYEVLGLKGKESSITPKEIAQAFRREAQKHHPDLVAPEGQEAAKAKMQLLLEAYGVLRDGALRKEYDAGIFTSPTGSAARARKRSDKGGDSDATDADSNGEAGNAAAS